MSLAMTQIARRRANQLGNFVRVLEFGAIHFYYRARIAKENFRGRFDNARFARAGRAQKQQVADGPSRRVQSRAKDLIEVYERLNALFLADDLGAHGGVEVTRIVAWDRRINLTVAAGLLVFSTPSA